MSAEPDFIVSAAAGDAEQPNSIAVRQSIRAAALQYICN
jgi:hypothetical protein